MNKGIMIATIVLSILVGYQNAFMDLIPTDFAESEVNIEVPGTVTEDVINDEIPEGADIVGYVYLDADMDIFITIPSGDWQHQKVEKMVVFIDNNSAPDYTSIAISSSILPVPEDERDDKSDFFFEQASENLNSFLENTEFEQLNNFEFNEHSAYRHICTGILTGSDMQVYVEYLYWWVGDREYTVSLFCSAEFSEKYSNILHEAMMSFQPASELG